MLIEQYQRQCNIEVEVDVRHLLPRRLHDVPGDYLNTPVQALRTEELRQRLDAPHRIDVGVAGELARRYLSRCLCFL